MIDSGWQKSKAKVFWGEIAPCEHVLQIYEDDDSFLDVLTNFVGDGINSAESVIVIASQAHIDGLESRLRAHGINVSGLAESNAYLPVNAEEALSKFMVNGWPDEALFTEAITEIINKAKKANPRIRAFGEMVAILWAQGNSGATVNLEHLWNKFCENESFSLFCAYPKAGFTQDANDSLLHICQSHSKMVTGTHSGAGDICYKNIQSSTVNL